MQLLEHSNNPEKCFGRFMFFFSDLSVDDDIEIWDMQKNGFFQPL